MIHVDIEVAEGPISGIVSVDGGAEAFAGWLQLVALIEAARSGSATGLASFRGEWIRGSRDERGRP